MLAAIPLRRKRPGRPKAGATRDERIKHIKCTYLFLMGGYPAASLARMHFVSRATIYNWRDLVLNQYDEPEAEGLRRMAEKSA